MRARVARKRRPRHPPVAEPPPKVAETVCALCGRPLVRRVERQHVVPKSEGGRETVAVHPICHRTIHATLPNRGLAGAFPTIEALRGHEAIARFLRWIADKPANFHAPTKTGNRQG